MDPLQIPEALSAPLSPPWYLLLWTLATLFSPDTQLPQLKDSDCISRFLFHHLETLMVVNRGSLLEGSSHLVSISQTSLSFGVLCVENSNLNYLFIFACFKWEYILLLLLFLGFVNVLHLWSKKL